MQKEKAHKKYCTLLAACAVTATLLSGCAIGHTHLASDAWEMDLNNHWKTCTDCGKKLEKGTHIIDEASEACTVCGAVVMDFGDYTSLRMYNESDEPLKVTDYDTNGKVLTETIFHYEYDAEGNLIHSSQVTDGVLMNESEYTIVNGRRMLYCYTGYMEDGSKSVSYYDENENVIEGISYNADGNEEMRTYSEYKQDAAGCWYEATTTIPEPDGGSYVTERNEYGDEIATARYDANNNLVFRNVNHDSHLDVYTYTYDADGNCETMDYYCNDVQMSFTEYATKMTEDGPVTYPRNVTVFEEDGTKTMTIYDESNQAVKEIRYDVYGAEIS